MVTVTRGKKLNDMNDRVWGGYGIHMQVFTMGQYSTTKPTVNGHIAMY